MPFNHDGNEDNYQVFMALAKEAKECVDKGKECNDTEARSILEK